MASLTDICRFCSIVLLLLPLCTRCQVTDSTPSAAASTSQHPPAPATQPTAAVAQENSTSSAAAASNSTSPPTTPTQGSSNTSTVAPTSNSSNSTAATNSTVASETNTTASTTQTPSDKTGAADESGTEETTTSFTTQADTETTQAPDTAPEPAYFGLCPSGLSCNQLAADCLNCSFDTSCVYGREYNTTCLPKPGLDCIGSLPIEKTYQCRYCYQTETWQQSCTPANNCQVYACPKQYIRVNCTVEDDVLCLGSRTFHRRKPCNWTSGYKWTTALILSITLGGFGADRFYLGYWQSGLGKLFSFGGAGVWTLIDVLLIAVGYITPSDGSHYIY